MGSELERWAITERQFLKDEIGWLKAGAKLISPSGDNVNAMKLEQLVARLEHLQKALDSEAD